MFDLVNREQMNLKQKPLIAMECLVIVSRCEGLVYKHASLERF